MNNNKLNSEIISFYTKKRKNKNWKFPMWSSIMIENVEIMSKDLNNDKAKIHDKSIDALRQSSVNKY